MSISGQEPIRIGQPNDSANSDSLYAAFNSIQNNFTTVFSTASNISTVSAGNGVQVVPAGNGIIVTNTGVTKLVAGDNVTITSLDGANSPAGNGVLVISSTGQGGNGGGTVTSIGVISNTLYVNPTTPITTAGNINVEMKEIVGVSGTWRNPNVTVNQNGLITSISNGTSGGAVTSVAVTANAGPNVNSGLSISGSPITAASPNGAGTINIINTGVIGLVAGPGISLSGSNGVVTVTNTGGGGGGGGGTVTRVGVLSNTLSVTGSPIITSGNINIEMPSNLVTNTISANSIVVTRANTNNPGIELDSYANIGISKFVGKRARGTPDNPQPIGSGDFLTAFQSKGYTSFNKFQDGSGIEFRGVGLPANSNSFIPSQVSIFSVDSSNISHSLVVSSTGNISIPGASFSSIFSDVSQLNTSAVARSRGNRNSLIPIQVGDVIFKNSSFGYTGNGTATINGIANYSLSTSTSSIAVALPETIGQHIPSDFYISTTSNANTTLNAVFSHTGNFTVPGSFNGDAANLVFANAENIRTSNISVIRNDTLPGIDYETYSNDANISRIVSRKSRGTSENPESIVDGDFLLGLQSKGYTAYNRFQNGCGILMRFVGNQPTSNTNSISSEVEIFSVDELNRQHTLTLTQTGNLRMPGSMVMSFNSPLASVNTSTIARARGTVLARNPILPGDTISRSETYGYTGNGLGNISGVVGYNFSSSTHAIAISVPTDTARIPSDYYITTSTNANTTLNAVFSHTGNFTIPGTFNGDSANLTGNIISLNANLGNLASANFVSGTLITGTQPNITTVGVLSGLQMGGKANLGPVGNVSITGGTSGQFLQTDGAGNLSWATGGGGGDSGSYIILPMSKTPPAGYVSAGKYGAVYLQSSYPALYTSLGLLAGPGAAVTWTPRTSGFGADAIYGIAYGGGLWAAVGSSGVITTSPDGITWTARTSGVAPTSIISVAYGAGLWAAGDNDGNILTSTDGISWTIRDSKFGGVGVLGIAYGNGLWVAVGLTGNVSTSPDGITWTNIASGFGTTVIRSVAYGGGLWVAVGDDGSLRTSPDGDTWTARISGFGTTRIRNVSYGAGLWMAVGDNGTITTSQDGFIWINQTNVWATTTINSSVYGAGLWITVGEDGNLRTSVDGVTWTEQASGFSSGAIKTVSYNNGLWIVGGNSGALNTSSVGYDVATQFAVPNPYPGNGLQAYIKTSG